MVSRPHGNRLVELARRRATDAAELEKLEVSEETAVTISNIVNGVFSPLEGFMCRDDFESVLEGMRLTNDLPWTIPLILRVPEEKAKGVREGEELSLTLNGSAIAVMRAEEVFSFDRKEYCRSVYGTTDTAHPGVSSTLRSPGHAIGGRLTPVSEPENPFERFTLYPKETRVLFQEKGWKTVVAFQTRNAPHIGHEYVQKTALAFADGIFINPVIGKKKKGDFKDEVILEAYRTLVQHYYPRDTVVLSVLRYEMQYAGPREAIMHAIMRKNFGCTHIAIGRDHAGVGNFYSPYAAQEIFREFPDLGITPIFFREFFYCKRCEGISNEKICPHGEQDRLTFSGTALRNLFLARKSPPKEFMRPEVTDVILRHGSPFVE
jgi:sulfate adenylyltransferase